MSSYFVWNSLSNVLRLNCRFLISQTSVISRANQLVLCTNTILDALRCDKWQCDDQPGFSLVEHFRNVRNLRRFSKPSEVWLQISKQRKSGLVKKPIFKITQNIFSVFLSLSKPIFRFFIIAIPLLFLWFVIFPNGIISFYDSLSLLFAHEEWR